MLVYQSQGQDIHDHDVVKIDDQYYIVWYWMEVCEFILYPLDGHSLQHLNVHILRDFDLDWEYLGHYETPGVYEQIPMNGPHDDKLSNIKHYLGRINL